MSVVMSLVTGAVEVVQGHPWIAALLLLTLFIVVVGAVMAVPWPGPNPFAKDTTRAPAPLVTDLTARDKVLKQGFTQKKVPENLDAIVIGSGIGGLSVANLLARVGKRVLVLEQHDQAGGCCHTFIEKGFEFDVGIHYIGAMHEGSEDYFLCNQLAEGQLQWSPLDEEHDVLMLGEGTKAKRFPIVHGGAENFRRKLKEMFPGEDKAIDKFIDMVVEVKNGTVGWAVLKLLSLRLCKFLVMTGIIHLFTRFFSYSCRSTKEVVEQLTDNKDLQATFMYCFGDYGVPPKDSPFAMHAMVIYHFMHGAYYPQGGSSEIAFHMIPPIERPGGKVLVRAPVSQILVDDSGKAIGVRVHKSSGDVDIFAPTVISDAGVLNTYGKLLPKEIAAKCNLTKLIGKGKPLTSGLGFMSLFVGLKGTTEELGLKAQNIWSFYRNDIDQLVQDYMDQSADEAMSNEVPMIFLSFPSAKDPTCAERYPGKSMCTVVGLANWKWFAQWKDERVMKRGHDYDAIKNAIGKQMWEHVLTHYPHLEDKVEYFEVGTPLSNNYYIAAPEGEIYGLDHTVKRFSSPEMSMALRPQTEIPGLYLTGQDLLTGGFVGAMVGGMLAACSILNRNLFGDMATLEKKMKKNK